MRSFMHFIFIVVEAVYTIKDISSKEKGAKWILPIEDGIVHIYNIDEWLMRLADKQSTL